jgi:hypothetical protein
MSESQNSTPLPPGCLIALAGVLGAVIGAVAAGPAAAVLVFCYALFYGHTGSEFGGVRVWFERTCFAGLAFAIVGGVVGFVVMLVVAIGWYRKGRESPPT